MIVTRLAAALTRSSQHPTSLIINARDRLTRSAQDPVRILVTGPNGGRKRDTDQDYAAVNVQGWLIHRAMSRIVIFPESRFVTYA